MLFMIFCEDNENSLHIRQETREAHLAYISEYNDRILVGGPTLSENDSMDGTLLIIDLPDREAVEKLMGNDPYNRAGLFKNITIKGWHLVRLVPPSTD